MKVNETKQTSQPSQPVINFTISNELVNLFRPTPSVAPPPVVLPVPATVDLACPSLLNPSRSPGLDMPLASFCSLYGLGDSVLRKLVDNAYTDARMLRFITIAELKEMEFRLGEIAALRDAVEKWSDTSSFFDKMSDIPSF
jgi:hypothetical protein